MQQFERGNTAITGKFQNVPLLGGSHKASKVFKKKITMKRKQLFLELLIGMDSDSISMLIMSSTEKGDLRYCDIIMMTYEFHDMVFFGFD